MMEKTVTFSGRVLGRLAAVAAITLGLCVVGFFGGQATRMSDEARASERGNAVELAVVKAAARTQKADQVKATATLNAELRKAAKKAHRHEIKRIRSVRKAERKRAHKEAVAAAASGYANGNSAGFSSGHSTGVQDGLVQGSDQLTCSDDPDVTWLPACGY